jgi:hypothetical protein
MIAIAVVLLRLRLTLKERIFSLFLAQFVEVPLLNTTTSIMLSQFGTLGAGKTDIALLKMPQHKPLLLI